MNKLHHFGLIRFGKKTGTSDIAMTGLGSGMIRLWALQNTPRNKVCVVVDIEERRTVAEYVGTADGFPEIREKPEQFEYELPDMLYGIFDKEVAKQAVGA